MLHLPKLWTPAEPVATGGIKPATMSRRGFLRRLGLTATMVCLGQGLHDRGTRMFMGVEWMITRRDGLPSTTIRFVDPKFIGKSYILEDTIMYVRHGAYLLHPLDRGL